MAFTKNAQEVLKLLYFKRKLNIHDGWMQIKTIREICGFEKSAPVIGSILALQRMGLVESETEELLDGSVFKFYRLVDKLPEGMEIETSIEIKFPEEKI